VTGPVLLDVNILIALFDAGHVHHDVAHDWFAANRGRGWATTPLTENAVLRIISNPKYGSNSERAVQVAARLQAFCASDDHHLWPATISLRDTSRFALSFASHRHLTDVYLLGLSKNHGGVLATFDRSIPHKAVLGAGADSLDVIGA
jgi:toxin-antitoxin system PIN domain toxin